MEKEIIKESLELIQQQQRQQNIMTRLPLHHPTVQRFRAKRYSLTDYLKETFLGAPKVHIARCIVLQVRKSNRHTKPKSPCQHQFLVVWPLPHPTRKKGERACTPNRLGWHDDNRKEPTILWTLFPFPRQSVIILQWC